MDEHDDPCVITIGELQLRRFKRQAPDACPHKRLEMDSNGETVQCTDCGVYVTAYWALSRVVRNWHDARERLKSEQERTAWERKKVLRTIAARKIEDAWKRGMAPTCPHCKHAVLPEDGMGGVSVNKQMEMQRRAHVAGSD